jgi:hypothetical protein
VRLGVDSKNVASGRGRDSVRVESNKQYNSGLFILDASHMPEGCGTWPAFWMYGPNWPSGGEVDIVEGVNSQATNSFAGHTGPGCSITNSGFTGTLKTSNCDVNAPGQATNVGCGISDSSTASYGSGFNANGGGVYATEWTDVAISIWFFPRESIPSDITSSTPNPSSWGLPAAKFGAPCDIDQSFHDQRIVINTALCGDWAGAVWSQDSVCSSSASTCQEFVQNNPSAFANAYWTINSLKVYQSGAAASGGPSASSATAVPTTLATATTTPAAITTASTLLPTTTTAFVATTEATSIVTSSVAVYTTTLATFTPSTIPTTTSPATSAVLPSTFATVTIAVTSDVAPEPAPVATAAPSAVPPPDKGDGQSSPQPGNWGNFGGGRWGGGGRGGRWSPPR